MRAWGSIGIWDLLCFKKIEIDPGFISGVPWKMIYHTEVIEVQVKGRESDPFTEEDKKALREHAHEIGAAAHYAYGKRMPLKKKIPGSRQRLQKNRTVIIENLSAPHAIP